MSVSRQLVAPHEAFQRRCEENTAWYRAQHERTLAAESKPATAQAGRSFGSLVQVTSGTQVPEHVGEPVTVFHSKILPKMSLFELGCALNRSARAGEEALLVTLALMTRYCATTATKPTAHMMHRLYVACLQVGMKAHSDIYFRNDAFAKLAGISYLEMNRLEAEVIRGLHWSVQVTREQIDELVRCPVDAIASTVAAPTFDELAAAEAIRKAGRAVPDFVGLADSKKGSMCFTPGATTPVKSENVSVYLVQSPRSAPGSPDLAEFKHGQTPARNGRRGSSSGEWACANASATSWSHSIAA
jgi:hypothetical protein